MGGWHRVRHIDSIAVGEVHMKGITLSQQVLERPTTPTADLDARRQSAEEAARGFPDLTAQDRCDAPVMKMVDGIKVRGSCGAQAFVRAVLHNGQDLLFCGHCIAENHAEKTGGNADTRKVRARRHALIDAGAFLDSDYARINRKPSPSGT